MWSQATASYYPGTTAAQPYWNGSGWSYGSSYPAPTYPGYAYATPRMNPASFTVQPTRPAAPEPSPVLEQMLAQLQQQPTEPPVAPEKPQDKNVPFWKSRKWLVTFGVLAGVGLISWGIYKNSSRLTQLFGQFFQRSTQQVQNTSAELNSTMKLVQEELSHISKQLKPVVEGTQRVVGQTDELITKVNTGYVQMSGKVETAVENLSKVTQSTQAFLDETRQPITTLARESAETLVQSRQHLAKVGEVIDHAAQTTKAANQLVTNAQGQLTEHSTQVTQLLNNANKAVTDAQTAAAGIKDASEKLPGVLDSAQSFLDGNNSQKRGGFLRMLFNRKPSA